MKKISTKKSTLLVLLMSLCLILSGCSSSSDTVSYTIDTLGDADDGYYVLKKDSKFYPVMTNGQVETTSELVRSTLSGKKTVIAASGENLDSIPVIEEGEKLIFKSSETLSDVIPFIPVDDYGYTIGILFGKTGTDSSYAIVNIGNTTFAQNSSAYTAFKGQISKVQKARIVSVGGQPISDNLITDVSSFSGLEQDNIYEVVIYEGTKQIKEAVTADTKVFSTNTSRLYAFKDVLYTDKGYVLMEFPANTPEGYYYTETGGLFYYKAQGEA